VKLLDNTGGTRNRDVTWAQQRDHEVDGTTSNREERSQAVAIIAA
jgi:hypothetical protein